MTSIKNATALVTGGNRGLRAQQRPVPAQAPDIERPGLHRPAGRRPARQLGK